MFFDVKVIEKKTIGSWKSSREKHVLKDCKMQHVLLLLVRFFCAATANNFHINTFSVRALWKCDTAGMICWLPNTF